MNLQVVIMEPFIECYKNLGGDIWCRLSPIPVLHASVGVPLVLVYNDNKFVLKVLVLLMYSVQTP